MAQLIVGYSLLAVSTICLLFAKNNEKVKIVGLIFSSIAFGVFISHYL